MAAGHTMTAEAAASVLREGGNAFDAVVAAAFASTVAEPVLSSLGGGGFLLAHTAGGLDRVYDCFAHTPRHRPPAQDLDFQPILADFGTVTQEFHIGLGSVATPGLIKGLFSLHRDLGCMPLSQIVEPAVAMARQGVHITPFQGYVFRVVESIYAHSASSLEVYASPHDPSRLVREGETLRLPALASTIEALAREGEVLFYQGEIGRSIVRECREGGGCLREQDLAGYEVARLAPLTIAYRGAQLLMNPPPACGGMLIAFALELLRDHDLHAAGFGSAEHLAVLARVMDLTNHARMQSMLNTRDRRSMATELLRPEHVDLYRREIASRPGSFRGTTHMNVIDTAGNVASMTVSNGEGCGQMVPGTGIMLNNMLGEQDLHPDGFHAWCPNTRLSSMMSPTLLRRPGGAVVATGSGGSNRIRTAVLQVLLNLVDFGMAIPDAVVSPRIHFEDGLLNVEGGFRPEAVGTLVEGFENARIWQEKNLFFGGAHTASFDPAGPHFDGAGDPRRDGVVVYA